jgi:hypothetical protein
MDSDPWVDLQAPASADVINARRVDPEARWNFFWGRDVDGRCLLVLRHLPASTPGGRLPRLKGMDVRQSGSETDPERALVWRLNDGAHRDIFYRLCVDIMESAAELTVEKEAIDVALARTWRWHNLLRGGRDGRLSPDEQKGLLGELFVLERHLLPALSLSDAVAAWQGPLGAPKDFEIGRISIEAKARRGAAKPFVTISSEHQLDTSGSDAVFLFVVELARAPAGTRASFTLTDVVTGLSRKLDPEGEALTAFEDRLQAAGYSRTDDYSEFIWVEGASRFYRVSEDFPRVTADGLPSGISDLRYALSLVVCEPFAVPVESVTRILEAGPDID